MASSGLEFSGLGFSGLDLDKRYGPLVGAKVGCGPSGALQVVARE